MEGYVVGVSALLGLVSLFLLAASTYGEEQYVDLARQARAGQKVLLWKVSCTFDSFLYTGVAVGLLSGLLASLLLFDWLNTQLGQVCGIGLGVALIATGLWRVATSAGKGYWRTVYDSLYQTLPPDPTSRERLFRYKDKILGGDSDELAKYLQ